MVPQCKSLLDPLNALSLKWTCNGTERISLRERLTLWIRKKERVTNIQGNKSIDWNFAYFKQKKQF